MKFLGKKFSHPVARGVGTLPALSLALQTCLTQTERCAGMLKPSGDIKYEHPKASSKGFHPD
jgi:hypothetical protein